MINEKLLMAFLEARCNLLEYEIEQMEQEDTNKRIMFGRKLELQYIMRVVKE